MISFGSGYLLKDIGKAIKVANYLVMGPLPNNPFPEPDSTPRGNLKHSYSNTSQYFSFSMTFDEINDIIKKSYNTGGIGINVVPKYNLIK